MKRAIKYFNNLPGSFFVMIFLLVFLPLFVVILVFSREETHIFINQLHNPFMDTIMRYWTLLGDGVVLVGIALIFLFIRYKLSLLTALAFVTGGLLAQALKLIFFRSMPRPVKYFEINNINYNLHIIEGVDMHSWMSFPSGHTATAFAVFTALAICYSEKKPLQLLFFILALGVAYSRVYLSQHFMMDVVGGAVLGLLSGYLVYILISKFYPRLLDKNLLNYK